MKSVCLPYITGPQCFIVQGPWCHIHHTSFFVTKEWAQYTKVFGPGKIFKSNIMQHSSLLDLFAEENEVL